MIQARQDNKVRLKLSGERNVEGEIAAKGELTFRISDASQAAIHFDYREDERLVLGIQSSAGFRISAKNTLQLSGGYDYDLESEEWDGQVQAELDFGKDVEVVIRQEFGSDGTATSVALTVSF